MQLFLSSSFSRGLSSIITLFYFEGGWRGGGGNSNTLLELNACLLELYDSHETFYIDCEIHGTWVRGLDPRVGLIWPYNKNSSRKIIFSTTRQNLKKNECVIW